VGDKYDLYGRLIPYYRPIRDMAYDWLMALGVPEQDGGFIVNPPYPESVVGPLIEVDAVGTGTMVVHRSVLEALEPPWFEYPVGWGSEDLHFCRRVKEQLGLPIYVDMSCVSGHFRNVPMGQAQFRRIYEGQGIARTRPTLSEGAEWLATFLADEREPMLERLQNYTGRVMADLWRRLDPQTDDERLEFYEREDVGQTYLLDLLNWNASKNFHSIRNQLRKTRRQRVWEIGAGIGTVAMQMAIQDCSVYASEPNDVLRGFAEHRWEWVKERVQTRWRSLDFAAVPPPTDDQLDLVIAIDVFEHLPQEYLHNLLSEIAMRLKVGGRLFCHNNWSDQDGLYPMHMDHSEVWSDLLKDVGIFPLGGMWNVKVWDD
jgi:SAM-dependent methyltransferase